MEDRLASVEQALARVEVRTEMLNRRLEEVADKLDRNHVFLTRVLHGSPEAPGLVVRLDRVEGWHKRTVRSMSILFTVVVPLALARIWDAMTKGHA